MRADPSRCVFCDQPFGPKGSPQRNSKEHIFRKKTLESLGWLKSPFEIQVVQAEGKHKTIPLVGDTFVASGICQECNGNWINTIDTDAEDVKLALARGEVRLEDLSGDQRQKLALWTAKASYALMAMKLGGQDGFDISHFHNFYRTRELPKNSAVLLLDPSRATDQVPLGQSRNGFWRIKGWQGVVPPVIPPGYKVGLRLGRLVIAFMHVTQPFAVIDSGIRTFVHAVAANGPVRRSLRYTLVDHEDMPYSALNSFMCNLSVVHRDALPPCRIMGHEIIEFVVHSDGELREAFMESLKEKFV